MLTRRAFWLFALTGALATGLTVNPAGAVVSGVQLTPRGHTDLASPGLDGQTKPRGKNGSVAILKNRAYVGGGQLFSGARSTNGRVCTDYGGVKVVDISNRDDPRVTNTIRVEDPPGAVTGPVGNRRRGLKIDNVSSSVSAVDAIAHGPAGKDIMAFATQRCEQGFFSGGQIEFWDVSNPAAPSRVGVWTGPPGKAWGIFEDLRMFTRPDKPGKVYAVATTPFSSGNTHNSITEGEFRLLDITDPANAVQIGGFPTESIGSNSNNGCRIFYEGRSAAPTPDGKHAILSYYDGAPGNPLLPRSTADIPSSLGGPDRTAALFDLDLDNLPQFVPGSNPPTYLPAPPSWGYPLAEDGGLTPAGQIADEGNAADVQPFTGPNNELLSFVSEDDFDPATTNVTIDAPGAAFARRGCEFLFGNKLYLRPGQQLSDDVAYVGRGCPGSPLEGSSVTAADPYTEDPNGKIALFEGGGSAFDGCSPGDKIKRAADAGAVGAMFSVGCCPLLGNIIPTGDGGLPSVPSVGIQQSTNERMVAQFPNRALAGAGFPASWTRSSATNATVRQYALAIGPATGAAQATAATNTSPIVITTGTTAHLLSTGDRVRIAGVEGNTAANGEWTITVLSATTFSLNGSSGNGAYTRGGTVVGPCLYPGNNCSNSAPRSDTSRFKSVANATDRAARVETNPTIVTLSAAAPARSTLLQVQPLTAPLASGTSLRFVPAGGGDAVTVSLSAAALLGATSLSVSGQPNPGWTQAALPAGSKGSAMPEIVGGRRYNASAFLEVESYTGGAYRAAVVWYDDSGAQVGTDSEIASVSNITQRTRFTNLVTAPATATRASMKFEWTGGATAAGVAFGDAFALVPNGLRATLKDEQGSWGSQRIIDFSKSPPAQVGSYRSPSSQQWPPRNDGVFAPSLARMFGNDVAFTTWHTDGLRVLNVSNPSAPREVASFVPPDVPDPSSSAGAGPSNRGGSGSCLFQLNPPQATDVPCLQRGQAWPDRALTAGVEVVPESSDSGLVAVTDINGGLFLLNFTVRRAQAGGGGSGAYYVPPGQGGSSAFAGCPPSSSHVISGTAGPDVLTGTTAGDRIFAGAGNDVVDALPANDCVDLGSGADRGQGGLGDDLMIAGTGNDRVSGSSGNDDMRGNSGNDRLDAGRGNDRVTGDAGNDTLLGSFGNDVLRGVSGKDKITGSRGRDRISGGAGSDRISGGSSNDRISGDAGNDRINGNSGKDSVKGNSGSDRIDVRDGQRDRVNCGSGRDTVLADRKDVVSRNCERVRRR